MKFLIHYGSLFLCSISSVFAAVSNDTEKVVKTVSYEQVLNWSLGLIIVLCLFFAGIWAMRKMGALPANSRESMKLMGGLSLGMREKLVLVQVGEKQLVLGVTPGRINKLLVLEGNEQLSREQPGSRDDGEFSKTLKQLLTGQNNE